MAKDVGPHLRVPLPFIRHCLSTHLRLPARCLKTLRPSSRNLAATLIGDSMGFLVAATGFVRGIGAEREWWRDGTHVALGRAT